MDRQEPTAPPSENPADWTDEQIAIARAAIFAQIEAETRADRARQEARRHEYPTTQRSAKGDR
jgi:hypothetical protein